jgi:hypothetical protein
MNIEITETHITDALEGRWHGMSVKLDGEGACFWSVTDGQRDVGCWQDGKWQPIPRYLYDAIMKHHREASE